MEERELNAIYRCFNEEGRCFEFRADSEDCCRNLLYVARACFPKAGIVDLCDAESGGEVRAETEDEDDFPETEFLKKGEDFKEIPLKIPPKKFDTRTLRRLVEALEEREERIQEDPEELVDIVEPPVELPLQVPTSEQITKEEEVREEERKVEEEEIRPLITIKVITAKVENPDHSGTFG